MMSACFGSGSLLDALANKTLRLVGCSKDQRCTASRCCSKSPPSRKLGVIAAQTAPGVRHDVTFGGLDDQVSGSNVQAGTVMTSVSVGGMRRRTWIRAMDGMDANTNRATADSVRATHCASKPNRIMRF